MFTINQLKQHKLSSSNQKLVCLTAYGFSVAKILDNYCNIILVGDSLGMALYGFQDTTQVTLQMMINHAKAVVKARKKSLIVVDMPFGTYENSCQEALNNCQKILAETKCDALKIEVDENIIPIAKFLCQNQIPLIGHIGLIPQSVAKFGGYKYQGKSKDSAQKLINISTQLEQMGALALVIEAVPCELATAITKKISIPTIGIGASLQCDGQILVTDDLLGINQDFKPKFVNHYANLQEIINDAVKNFASDVRNEKFPTENNLIHAKNLFLN